MNKFLKVAVALALLLAVVIVAQGGAWAAKVDSADSAPVAAVDGAGAAVARPAGTVGNTMKSVRSVDGAASVKKAGLPPAGAPAGTLYMTSCPASPVEVVFETGPNWGYGVYLELSDGSWMSLGATQVEEGKWKTSIPCNGTAYFIIGAAK